MNVLNTHQPSLFLWAIIFFTINIPLSQAQDQIFLLDDTKFTCRILEVDKKVTYQSLTGNNEQKIPVKDVAWISYANGNIEVFHETGKRTIPFDHEHYDKILLRSFEIVPVEIKGFDEGNISFINLFEQQLGEITIPKSEILALIYRNKQIIQYNAASIIAQALFKADQPQNVPQLASQQEVEVTTNAQTQAEQQPVEPAQENIQIHDMDKPLGEEILMDSNDTDEEFEMVVDQDEFVGKALDKTRRLTQYIRVITDKNTDKYESNKAVNEAIVLFMSDTCVVQVSNVNNPQEVKEYYIRPYLNHVKLLKYDKVEIEWAEINYVGDVRKGPDGNFYGYVTFVQTFRGFKDGDVVYEDKTEKRVEVVLKSYELDIGGTSKELWDVLLSNIKVDQTYRL